MGSTWVLVVTDGPHVGPMNPMTSIQIINEIEILLINVQIMYNI